MNPSETALLGYFFTISTRPRVKAAAERVAQNVSPETVKKLAAEFLGCVGEDLPAVIKVVGGNAVVIATEKWIKPVVNRVVEDVVGGAAGALFEGLDALFGQRKRK